MRNRSPHQIEQKGKHEKQNFLFSLQQLEEEFGIYEYIPTGIISVFS